MLLLSLCFLAGIIVLHQLAVLPGLIWPVIACLMLVPGYLISRLRPLAFLAAGFVWAWLSAWAHYQHSLPQTLEGVDLQLTGEVVSLPENPGLKSRFLFRVSEARLAGERVWNKPGLVRLTWYASRIRIEPGQQWRLTVRLKRPNGFRNPAGFDYEGWLFQQRISATGYVRESPGNEIIGQSWNLQVIRHALQQRLMQNLQDLQHSGIIEALALGVRSGITQQQWDMFQRTGTSHLIAISGLHIGLVAGLCFLLGKLCWRVLPQMCLYLPATKAGAVLALAGASLYAFLAGFAIPTQRALVMIVVVMYSILTDRNDKPSQTYALALLAVLVLDPSAVLSGGFWLSFAAVGVLLYGLGSRYGQPAAVWHRWGRAQWVVSIGLVPLTLYLFQMASIVSPLTNLIAIPWISVLVVPVALLGTLMSVMIEPLAQWLLQIADLSLMPLQWVLQQSADAMFSHWVQPAPSTVNLLLAVPAVLLLLSPRGLPLKPVGLVLILPVFINRPDALSEGQVQFTVLDVGQGLAAVVQTRTHVLVFDVGPRFNDSFDTGNAVVVPFLRQQGITHIDTMVISHGDNDHRGGFESVRKQMHIMQLYSGVPEKLSAYGALVCDRTQHWQWDGVRFRFLHPDQDYTFRKNDRSCVLKIEAAGGSILLTGDIHRKSEHHLIRHLPAQLRSDILVAPHHGSKTSSHAAFIAAVDAEYVIFPAGYRNRFRHPHPRVRQRYELSGATILESSKDGAIQFDINKDGIDTPVSYRPLLARHWNRR